MPQPKCCVPLPSARRLLRVHRRLLPPVNVRRLIGAQVVAIERRGKHQLIRFGDGSTLHVHFRMTGDWEPGLNRDPIPAYARVVINFTDGTRVALTDPRALSTLTFHKPGVDPLPNLGLDANDPAFTADVLGRALSKRRIAIKPALLDQRVVAGIGNIYATEALWLARIDPRRPAPSLDARELARLVKAIRRVSAVAVGRPSSELPRRGARRTGVRNAKIAYQRPARSQRPRARDPHGRIGQRHDLARDPTPESGRP
jgi:formamidopyrimidine-DNA glycosylase